ncbi:hypothetical protein COCMIDRAFT_29507 [Bipolaris oryzae ATCC 44560]|uniref:Uncharacterized protein n=1 Tax=Bipolaris oryzae ATCC 44560 TaxID=930090 RepID=W6ZE31_COCMI|nr:uncharacterized protein COCMIDRAFT_29507 [Bipolaris oryzae ATCC 44560]EUC41771.1 hypothetical protein COCMIDRAFT_29507 [Bipolaris oryzae ATCC 44560]
MKLQFIFVGLIATLASARVVVSPSPSPENVTHVNVTLADVASIDSDSSSTAYTFAEPTKFEKSAEIGRTLDAAMKSKDSIARWFFKDFPNFQETCQSPFDGDGREELARWGFDDSEKLRKEVEKECDFDAYHGIKPAFDEVGLDTKAEKDGGPNKCFKINHRDGSAIKRLPDGSLPLESKQYYDVCGKEYRATGATYEFAVNPNGLVALMNIMSLSFCAEKFTWFRKPLPEELPHIGTPSDIAWAVWNRAGASNIADVKYLLVTQIMNPTSRDIIRTALGTLQPPHSETQVWPGSDFTIDTVGGRAILGSPIGRWAGYFLLQHKKQLGGNRFISKVRAFRPNTGSLPYLVFYVDPTPAGPGAAAEVVPHELAGLDGGLERIGEPDGTNSSHIVERIADGKHFVREHILHAGT